jgi:KDO2-lipid IV(A) lauroyltransferase
MNDERIYKLLKLMVDLLAMIPRRILNFFSDLLGLVWYMLDKRHRNVVLENINLAYPKKFSKSDAKKFTRKNLKFIAGFIFEIIWSYSKKQDELYKYFSIKGLANIENAIKKRKGVILLTGHMGNFELFIPAFAKAGIEPYVLYRKFDFKPLERLMCKMRQRFGVTLMPLRGASKKIDEILKNGGIVGTMLDQTVDWYKWVFVNFFGKPACTNNGLAKIVLRSKPAVDPLCIIKKNKNYIFEFFPEIP